MQEKATFGAGCFWGVEATFRKVKGVLDVVVGYEGGKTKNPTYEDVCTNTTGHAEVVQVTFDPKKISYEKILNIFWKCHNPTQVNRQGLDFGTQYRSVIFYHSKKQQAAAEKSKAKIQKKYKDTIATAIEPAKTFYKAEEYHQRYHEKHKFAIC